MPGEDLGLPDAVFQLSFSVHEILGSVAAEFGLSLTQVRMLGVLRDRTPGMLQLADILQLEKSSATGLVDRAERRGLVARARDRDDARGVRVALTRDGRRLAERLTARVEAEFADLIEPMPEREQAQLSRTASRVVWLYAESRGLDLRTG